MRLVGAKNSYIRGPFLLEGAFIGLLGATIPSALVFVVYQMVYNSVNQSLIGQNLFYDFTRYIYSMMIALYLLLEFLLVQLDLVYQ